MHLIKGEYVDDKRGQSCGGRHLKKRRKKLFQRRTRIDIFTRSAIITTEHTCKEERNHEKGENLRLENRAYLVHWVIMQVGARLTAAW